MDNLTLTKGASANTTLGDIIAPDEASAYISRAIYMEFDWRNEKAHDESLDAFRNEKLIPAIFTIASIKDPELLREEVDRKATGAELWMTIMLHMVTAQKLPETNDPDRFRKTLDLMDASLKSHMELIIADQTDEAGKAPSP